MIESQATFSKTSLSLWRDRLLALGCLLIAGWFVSAAFHTHGHDTLCLILQITACVILLAAAGLSVFLLSKPVLHVNKVGISENGFLLNELNWSMAWNEIAYAELKNRQQTSIVLVGLDSDLPEHVLDGYDQCDTIVSQIKDGLRKYGRRVVAAGNAPFSFLPK